MIDQHNTKTNGIGFTGLLQLVFITLKLLKVINWSWVWVLSPVWISVAFVVLLLLIYFAVLLVLRKQKRGKKKANVKNEAPSNRDGKKGKKNLNNESCINCQNLKCIECDEVEDWQKFLRNMRYCNNCKNTGESCLFCSDVTHNNFEAKKEAETL
jgi:hypothetical protein